MTGSDEAAAWPGAELAALAEGIGRLRSGAGALLPDADWSDEAARVYAERAAEMLGALAVAEAQASALAAGGAA